MWHLCSIWHCFWHFLIPGVRRANSTFLIFPPLDHSKIYTVDSSLTLWSDIGWKRQEDTILWVSSLTLFRFTMMIYLDYLVYSLILSIVYEKISKFLTSAKCLSNCLLGISTCVTCWYLKLSISETKANAAFLLPLFPCSVIDIPVT